MNCPVCGKEMAAGGLWVSGTLVRWLPEKDFRESTLFKIVFPDAKVLKGKTNHLMKETKVPGAYYCENCGKIVGIFDLET